MSNYLSSIKLPNGDIYEFKDNVARSYYKALNGLEIKKKYKQSFIEASNTTEESINNFILYGKTIQNGTPTSSNPIDMVSVGSTNNITLYNTGANLLVTSASPKTQNGITFTINNDGMIIANGTATAQAVLYLYFYLPQGKYCMSGCPSGGSNSTYDTYVYIAGGGRRPPDWNRTSEALSDYGNGTRFLAENAGRYFIGCRIFTGYTANNVVFKPMITSEENENKDFEPYNNNNNILLSLTNELRGIPVSNNGNYTDTNGQQWICDTIDLFNKKYTQRIGIIDNYNNEIINSPWMSNKDSYTENSNPSNGATVLYPLASPIITDLTNEQITALNQLRSYNDTTTIYTVDECQPEMETSIYTSFNI